LLDIVRIRMKKRNEYLQNNIRAIVVYVQRYLPFPNEFDTKTSEPTYNFKYSRIYEKQFQYPSFNPKAMNYSKKSQ
jgi:hypothetical protein